MLLLAQTCCASALIAWLVSQVLHVRAYHDRLGLRRMVASAARKPAQPRSIDSKMLIGRVMTRLPKIQPVLPGTATASPIRTEGSDDGSSATRDRYLDVAQALDRCGHDRRLLQNVLTKFAAFCPEELAGIADAISCRDIDKLRRHAHSLKGVSGDVAAVELHRAATTLERASREGRAGQAWADAEQIKSCIETTLGVVNALIADLQQEA